MVECLHDLFMNDLVFYQKHYYNIKFEEGDFITIYDEYHKELKILRNVRCTITFEYYFRKLEG